MKRTFASGAEKRKKQQLLKVSEQKLSKLDAFFQSSSKPGEASSSVIITNKEILAETKHSSSLQEAQPVGLATGADDKPTTSLIPVTILSGCGWQCGHRTSSTRTYLQN